MPTNNPKVSAYVPQHIFDRFKDFYEERKLSMSQAVAVIFSDYFQVEQNVNHSGSQVSDSVLSRLEAIEQKFSSISKLLYELNSELPERVNQLADSIASLEQRLNTLEGSAAKQIESSQQVKAANPTGEPDEDILITFIKTVAPYGQYEQSSSGSLSKPSNEPLVEQLKIVNEEDVSDSSASEPLSEPIDLTSFEPLNNKAMMLRIDVSQPTISSKKKSLPKEEFLQWINSRDRDGVKWKLAGSFKDRFLTYVPESDTSPELLAKLQEWVKRNKHLF